MKKLISIALIGTAVAFTFSACTKKAEETNQTESQTESVDETETETAPESESPEETTKAAKNEEKKPDFGPLSDDPYSFQLQIDEDVYQFPMTYKEFQSYGWVSQEDDTQTLDSGFRTSTWVMKMGDLKCYVYIVNFDVNGRPLNECYVSGITIDTYMIKKTESKVMLPGGFVLGESTPEELKTAYGTPSYENVSDKGSVSLKYSLDSYQTVGIRSDLDGKVLGEIKIDNIKKPDDFEESEINTDVPEIITKYQAPDAISDNFGDYNFNLDGKLYKLPTPVSQFIEDGWVVLDGGEDKVISGRDLGRISLMKDNQKISVGIMNYSENATAAANCFLLEIESEVLPITIGKGITLGMTKEEVESALSDTAFDTDDSSSYSYYFEIVPGDSSLNRYVITVKKETNKVSKIKISFQPKYSEFTKQ